jgi:hypothetical protein
MADCRARCSCWLQGKSGFGPIDRLLPNPSRAEIGGFLASSVTNHRRTIAPPDRRIPSFSLRWESTPLRWIGAVGGRPEHQRSSAWISGFPGFWVVRFAIRSPLATWDRFRPVAPRLCAGTIIAWLPFGIARRRRCGEATLATTACPSLAVGLFAPGDAAVRHELARKDDVFCRLRVGGRPGSCRVAGV